MTTDARAGTRRGRWRRAIRALPVATLLAIYPARKAVEYAAQIREFLAARVEFDPNRVLTSTFVEKIEALLGQ
jgi:hypothetical protein